MFCTPKLEASIEPLGTELLDAIGIKAVIMSKNEDGGTEDSHKVKFGRVDRKSWTLTRPRSGGNGVHEVAAG
jgi:hypothetical protein